MDNLSVIRRSMGQLMNNWVALPEGSHFCNMRKPLLCLSYLAMGTLSKWSCNLSAVRETQLGNCSVYRENLEFSSFVWKAFKNQDLFFQMQILPSIFSFFFFFWKGKYCIFITNILRDYITSAEIFFIRVISNGKAQRNNKVLVCFSILAPFASDPILDNSRSREHSVRLTSLLNKLLQKLLPEKPVKVNNHHTNPRFKILNYSANSCWDIPHTMQLLGHTVSSTQGGKFRAVKSTLW